MSASTTSKDWARWLEGFGAEELYDSFLQNAQAALGRCVWCGDAIYLDIEEGGGVPNWKTADGDYGCDNSPDTTEDGVGSHFPQRGNV